MCHAGKRALAGEGQRHSPARSRATGAANVQDVDNFSGCRESNAQSRATGARFEARALDFLRSQRLVPVARNVHCRGGELDLVMRDRDGTLVFVEVRARTRNDYGGAAASVGWHKQQRVLRAARYFLATRANAQKPGGATPPCRFDVIAFERGRLTWIRDAFRADGS
ncbi:YraN family protein [Paraburkholderia sp. B3]|uniref:YraN family protein n=1 Tax=Paraburkholderia sp. B3 TaxID=3134791 RepID=UPI003982C23C